MLNGVAIAFMLLMANAPPQDKLDQLDLDVPLVAALMVIRLFSGLSRTSAFDVLCCEVVHVHEAVDPHRFNKKPLGGRKDS
jgi:hypothetical protein